MRLAQLLFIYGQIISITGSPCKILRPSPRRFKRALVPSTHEESQKHNKSFEITPFTKDQLWPHGVVPFRFSSDYGGGSLRRRVLQAMRSLEEVTCVRFLPVKQNYKDNHAIITHGDDCASFVGRQPALNSGQNLSLPSWCLDRPQGALHELLHVLGFGHEQTRPDRDQYVSINWLNIPKKYWFTYEEDADAHYFLRYRIPYDYASILHYGPYDFAKDKRSPTLEANKVPFWVRSNRRLSRLDAVKVNSAYNCTAHLWREQRTCKDYLPECPYMVTPQDCAQSHYLTQICHRSCKGCIPTPLYWPVRPTPHRSPR